VGHYPTGCQPCLFALNVYESVNTLERFPLGYNGNQAGIAQISGSLSRIGTTTNPKPLQWHKQGWLRHTDGWPPHRRTVILQRGCDTSEAEPQGRARRLEAQLRWNRAGPPRSDEDP
jgi:hypothetical protein